MATLAAVCAGLAGLAGLAGCSHKTGAPRKAAPEAGSTAVEGAATTTPPTPVTTGQAPPTAQYVPRQAPAPTGSVRLVVVRQGELLGSEKRALADLTHALEKQVGALTVVGAQPSGEEATAGLAVLGDATPSHIPVTWSSARTVVIVQVLGPRGTKPNRTSSGVGGIAVLRPPSATPIYLERVKGDGLGAPLSGDMAGWIAGAVALAGGKS